METPQTDVAPPPSIYRDLLIEGDLAGLPYTHIAIFFELLDNGPATPDELTQTLPRGRGTITDALKELHETGLCDRRTDPDEPRSYIYGLSSPPTTD